MVLIGTTPQLNIQKELPVRSFNHYPYWVLNDLESHISWRHNYQHPEVMIYAHELTHGVNSFYRQKYRQYGKINCFYLLNNQLVVIAEPNITISDIARILPQCMRGREYQTYLLWSQRDWQHEPLYLIDEWSAYTNGCFAAIETNDKASFQDSFTMSMDMMGYVIYLSSILPKDYDDRQLKLFIKSYSKLLMHQMFIPMHKKGWLNHKHYNFLTILQNHPHNQAIRKFCKTYHGEAFCKNIWGF